MLVWRRITSERLVDSWADRLMSFDLKRLVVTQVHRSTRVRLELFDITKTESEVLLNSFGGEVRDLQRSSADWVRSVVQGKPISIRGRLLIRSTDSDKSVSEFKRGQQLIRIPASLAFGTGDHATTASCLRLLCDVARELAAWRHLDIGTGTAILAIAAEKLGAREVEAFDFDPVAVRIARQNLALNQSGRIRLRRQDVLQFTSTGNYQVVTANLYSELFLQALPRIWPAVAPGGCLIVSGVMRDQAEKVRSALLDLRARELASITRGKWVTTSWRCVGVESLADGRFPQPGN
jgi:ribosomal protein L11 methyltransferase